MPEPWSILSLFPGAAGPEGEGRAADGRGAEAGYVAVSWGLYFAHFGRDGEVFQGLRVAALGADELAELLVGRAGGEGVLDGGFCVGDAFQFEEAGGDVVHLVREVVGDGLVL